MAKIADTFSLIRNGANIKQGLDDSGYPITRIETISGRTVDRNKMGYAGVTDISKYSDYVLQDGDILMSHINSEAHLGKVALYEKQKGEMIIHGMNLLCLRPKQELLDSRFAFYYFSSEAFLRQIPRITKKSVNQASFNVAALKELIITIPTIEKQREIVCRLDKVSELIALRKEQLAKLDQLVKARFVEMFGDPKLNDKGWKNGIVSDYFDVKGGKRIPKGMGYSDRKTNHPYLRATDMKNETIIEDDIHYIDEDVFQHIKRYTVKGGDIYLTNVGVNLGMAGVIPPKFDGANLTENAVKLVPKTKKVIDGLFFSHYINSPGIQEYINERKMIVGVPKLAIFRIETMPLLIPPMDVQQDFNAFVEQTDKSKLTIQQSLDKLEVMKKALMQEYFG